MDTLNRTPDRADFDPLRDGYLTAEEQAVVAGIRARLPATTDLNWDTVWTVALTHGVAPLLHEAWKDAPDSIPPSLLTRLAEARRRTLRYSTVGMWQRDEVVDTLQRAGVRCLVLKGAALARHWYGDLSLRAFSDIDLLLSPEDLARGRNALLAAGYGAVPSGPGPHHDVPLRHAGLPCAVELHHRLTGIPIRHELSFEELYTRSVTVPTEGAIVRTLAPEDTLLHLCLHVMSHIVLDQGWRLRQICDIQRQVLTNTVDWALLLERSRALGIHRACGGVLGATSALMALDLPGDAVDDAAAQAILRQGPALQWDEDNRRLGLYEFIAVLAVGDVRRAVTMISRDRVGVFDLRFGASEASQERGRRRFAALVGQARRLAQDVRQDPVAAGRQFRTGVRRAYRRQQHRRLVADLLSDR